MVLVENLFGLGQIQMVFCPMRPGQLNQPVQVGAHHGIFGRTLLHLLHPIQFARSCLHGLLWQIRRVKPIAQFVHFGHHRIGSAQLFLDLSQLLAQKVLALRFTELLLDLGLDSIAHFEDLYFARQEFGQILQTLFDIERF